MALPAQCPACSRFLSRSFVRRAGSGAQPCPKCAAPLFAVPGEDRPQVVLADGGAPGTDELGDAPGAATVAVADGAVPADDVAGGVPDDSARAEEPGVVPAPATELAAEGVGLVVEDDPEGVGAGTTQPVDADDVDTPDDEGNTSADGSDAAEIAADLAPDADAQDVADAVADEGALVDRAAVVAPADADASPADPPPGDTPSEDAAPDDVVPDDVVPDDVVPEDGAPDDVVPEDVPAGAAPADEVGASDADGFDDVLDLDREAATSRAAEELAGAESDDDRPATPATTVREEAEDETYRLGDLALVDDGDTGDGGVHSDAAPHDDISLDAGGDAGDALDLGDDVIDITDGDVDVLAGWDLDGPAERAAPDPGPEPLVLAASAVSVGIVLGLFSGRRRLLRSVIGALLGLAGALGLQRATEGRDLRHP